MMPLSLRWRLLIAGGAAILLALGLATAGLALLFDRHVERVAVINLEARASALAAVVEPVDGGAPVIREGPDDPLYAQPFSGYYWQARLGEAMIRSRSLWDYVMPVPDSPLSPGSQEVLTLAGPRGEALLAIRQSLLVGSGADAVPLELIVASERAALAEARRGFFSDLLPYLALLFTLLLAGFWAQTQIGLRPLSRIAQRVGKLADGSQARIGGGLPSEVMPLAAQLDRLLEDRDREMTRARHRAADLAHGFKTPLQALMGDAGQLRQRGETDIADSIELVATSMRRLVDRELARARIQSDRGSVSTDPSAVITKLLRVMQRMPKGAELDWTISAEPGLLTRIDADDLTEALGAVMENAMRHAATRVDLSIVPEGSQVAISIRDDGPGIPEQELARIQKRGERLDQSGDGQGIGLALVTDILDAAGGELSLRNAAPGLLVEIRLLRLQTSKRR